MRCFLLFKNNIVFVDMPFRCSLLQILRKYKIYYFSTFLWNQIEHFWRQKPDLNTNKKTLLHFINSELLVFQYGSFLMNITNQYL